MDINQAKRSPSGVFHSPEQVLHDARLTKEDKIAILRSWAQYEQEKLTAEEENMLGGEDGEKLSAIYKVLSQLENGCC